MDWLSLSGINMILALTGQEEIQYRVLSKLGLRDIDIRQWFNGPALLTWSRGQNEYGNNICGPLPRSWMQAQFDMQRNFILPRLRSLGIVGQLPGFQGNVPIQLKDIVQDANITQQGATGWMDALDPLYGKIADMYMKELLDAFGTDHWYQLDGYFNGETAPWMVRNDNGNGNNANYHDHDNYESNNKSIDYRDVDSSSFHHVQLNDDMPHDNDWYHRGSAVYQALQRSDPDAMWSFQGFAFIGWDDNSLQQAKALKGFVDAAPPGHFVIMDMSYTGMGEWQKFHNASFFGAPFVWTALHDFGGTDGIKGDIRRINRIPYELVHNTSIVGVGGTPEGIDQNPAYYDFLFESNFRTAPVKDLNKYMGKRKVQQYGLGKLASPSSRQIPKHVKRSWSLLMQSLYSDERSVQDKTGIAHLQPSDSLFEKNRQTPSPELCQVFQAWKHLLRAAQLAQSEQSVSLSEGNNEPFRYDLVNLGREVLAQLSTPAALNFTDSTKSKPLVLEELLTTAGFYIGLLNDTDTLVATDQAFLLGPWIEAAKQWGNSATDDCYASELESTNCIHFYEWNARTQITTWNPTQKNSTKIPGGPIDYAAKQWSGLFQDYYAARAAILLHQAVHDYDTNSEQSLNQTAVDQLFAQHAYRWTTSTNSYQTTITGDAVAVSTRLFHKYKDWFSSCEVVSVNEISIT